MEEEAEAPLLLGRYRLLQEAGSGGYATVQLAWDTRIQRKVAVKCLELGDAEGNLNSQDLTDQDSWDQVPGLEEARTAALLNHPNIVTVYDFAVEHSCAYLFMEYVDGLTLRQVMQEAREDMNTDMVAAVFSDVAHALTYAHDNQVLHLDIKPENVLINHEGQVKVSDFGLATLSGSQGFSSATGGTIGYMPPEQIRLQQLDERCDEWALASLTYEMISDQNPFRVRSLSKAAETIENAEIALPSLCMEGLTDEADDVICYALDPDRDERYDTVADFANELLPLLGNAEEGHRQLADLVFRACDDGEVEPEPTPRGPIPSLGKTGRAILTRLWAAANTAALGFAALSFIPAVGKWDDPIYLGVYAALIAAAAILPHIGVTLALIAFGLALFVNEAFIPGVALVAAAAGWWYTCGRKDPLLACATTAPATAGLLGFSWVAPLLAGLSKDVKGSLIASLMSLLIATLLAGLGSASLLGYLQGAATYPGGSYSDVLVTFITTPAFWVLAATWVLSALITAAIARKGTRRWAITSAITGCLVLVAGYLGASFVEVGALVAPEPLFFGITAATLAANIAGAFCLFPPMRGKE